MSDNMVISLQGKAYWLFLELISSKSTNFCVTVYENHLELFITRLCNIENWNIPTISQTNDNKLLNKTYNSDKNLKYLQREWCY